MIEIKNAVMKFDKFTALDDVSISIESGSAYGLLGSNGAGKSTILRLISGIYRQNEGTVAVDGEEPFGSAKTKSKIFFVNDETVQWNDFTVSDIKRFYKGFYPKFSEEIFDKLTASVSLPKKKKLSAFSKGMKRQTLVIAGIACCTDYLLIDEAFDGLDPAMRIIVKRMLVDAMLDRKLTVIASSHNMKEINELCDRAALIHKGKVLFDRSLDGSDDPIVKIQAVFPKEYNGKEDFPELEVLKFERNMSVCSLIVKGSEREAAEALSAKNPTTLDILPLSLEEIFIYEMEGAGYDIESLG